MVGDQHDISVVSHTGYYLHHDQELLSSHTLLFSTYMRHPPLPDLRGEKFL
jgi:hypothetical protein